MIKLMSQSEYSAYDQESNLLKGTIIGSLISIPIWIAIILAILNF